MKDEAGPQCPTPAAVRTRRQTAKLLLAAVASLSASLGITETDAAGMDNDANQAGAGQPHKTQPHETRPHATYSRKKLPGRMKSGTLTMTREK